MHVSAINLLLRHSNDYHLVLHIVA